MKVIDASVAVKWFMHEPGRDAAMEIIRSGEVLVAPDFVVFEVLNVLRRKQRQQMLKNEQLINAVQVMTTCFSQLMPSVLLAQEAVRLSNDLDHSVYDCAYLACGFILQIPLVTADRVFAGKALGANPGHQVLVLDGR